VLISFWDIFAIMKKKSSIGFASEISAIRDEYDLPQDFRTTD